MIPLLIGAAAVGLAGLALSGDDKKKASTTTREIPPSEVPPDVREKLDTPSEPQSKKNILLSAPAEGDLVALSEIGDKDFSQGKCRGAAIENNYTGKIISPFNGRVIQLLDDGLVIESNDGIILIIQFGLGTVFVGEGDRIEQHQNLAAINLQVSSTVAFVVKNDKDFGDIIFTANGKTITVPANGQTSTVSATNSSTGDNSMDGRKFTILGETGSGKTCYLLGMYYEMSMSVAGYTVIATDPDADKNLTLRYEMLKDKSRGQNRFPAGTDDVQKFRFNLQYDYETILPFTWVDYPGGFLDATRRDVGSDQYKEVEQSIKESEMLFICIDGANLVGSGTRNKIRKVKTRCAKHINPYLTELRNKFKNEGKGGLPPIGMLITKYDMCQEDTDPDEIREIVEEAFEGLFDEEDNQNVIAIIPVSLGDTLQDDSYQGDLDPINIHLPILMGINFALIDQLYYGKYLIEQQRENLDWARQQKRVEDNRWGITRWLFGGYDPDALGQEINDTEQAIRDNRQVAKYFTKSLKRMNRELDAVEMIFANGTWLNKGGIKRFWHDVQQIADYNF